MHKYLLSLCAVALSLQLSLSPSNAWNNGPSGNSTTNTPSECSNPPYGTHDWIADHALALLPEEEQKWIKPYKTYFLLGTEAPDNSKIPEECGTPITGYGDKGGNHHSVRWDSSFTKMTKDGAAARAQEEYAKAAKAYHNKDYKAAAFYLGAMAHYIGDVSSYPHSSDNNSYHSKYETWVARYTTTATGSKYEAYIKADRLTAHTPYDAVENISKKIAKGTDQVGISGPDAMDDQMGSTGKSQEFTDSVGSSLNVAVNELADVLHSFYLNEVR